MAIWFPKLATIVKRSDFVKSAKMKSGVISVRLENQ